MCGENRERISICEPSWVIIRFKKKIIRMMIIIIIIKLIYGSIGLNCEVSSIEVAPDLHTPEMCRLFIEVMAKKS